MIPFKVSAARSRRIRSIAFGAALLVAGLSAPAARADEWAVLRVNRVRVASDGWAYFGTTERPAGVCSQWGDYFRFDTTTPGGKSMYAILVSAKLSGNQIEVWYPDTPYPNTDQTNGCAALTTVWMIALH